MREVIHQYGVELDWVADIAPKLGGYVDGNHIIVPGEERPGTRYVLRVNDNISVFVIDVSYTEDVVYRLRNTRDDFVGIYFNLTEGDAVHVYDNVTRLVGRWASNLAVFDADLKGDYFVKRGSTTFKMAVFVKKTALKDYFSKEEHYAQVLDAVFDPAQNTIVKYDRMSNHAWWLMNELKNTTATGLLYEVMVRGTVYGILSDYLDQTMNQEIILEKVVQEDIVSIIGSQYHLIEHITEPFPGISTLAAAALMSETKYKKLFKKITGTTPNAFFLTNKLSFAKEKIATGNFTVGEIADQFNFTDASHLIEQFKTAYGITPKEYLTLL
ncbi:AraC-like DNA-binding protein [Pedobacter cryoconitis]|uniref:AraC-like DNA-binding protein n=1 Tax=Pedobacter cryoconitis TaxID=188932 RepID=A0A7W9E0J2_9SPHI|nr:AraC family transcriptional regulator [Pedobacter cryoconitis]MBB5638121.1 AraC-like DNA-binding protein [Pedobacter cryoconitis]MBB6271065.1 AraC-like DNA-binding protein [Pedobacter cryoconitis]